MLICLIADLIIPTIFGVVSDHYTLLRPMDNLKSKIKVLLIIIIRAK